MCSFAKSPEAKLCKKQNITSSSSRKLHPNPSLPTYLHTKTKLPTKPRSICNLKKNGHKIVYKIDRNNSRAYWSFNSLLVICQMAKIWNKFKFNQVIKWKRDNKRTGVFLKILKIYLESRWPLAPPGGGPRPLRCNLELLKSGTVITRF